MGHRREVRKVEDVEGAHGEEDVSEGLQPTACDRVVAPIPLRPRGGNAVYKNGSGMNIFVESCCA